MVTSAKKAAYKTQRAQDVGIIKRDFECQDFAVVTFFFYEINADITVGYNSMIRSN